MFPWQTRWQSGLNVCKQERRYLPQPDDGVNTSVHQTGSRLRSQCPPLPVCLSRPERREVVPSAAGARQHGDEVAHGGTGCQSFISSPQSHRCPKKKKEKKSDRVDNPLCPRCKHSGPQRQKSLQARLRSVWDDTVVWINSPPTAQLLLSGVLIVSDWYCRSDFGLLGFNSYCYYITFTWIWL